MKISVSYLGAKNISDTIMKLDQTDADLIHVDVMDGKYVDNKSLSFSEVKNIGYYTKKRLDIHFMVTNPLKYIDEYAELNVLYMSFHLDIKDNLEDVIKRTKMYGIKVGLVINPNDDISLLEPYLDEIDLVLIMTVIPGLPGQELIKDVIPKISKLRKKLDKDNRTILISVDGGVNIDNKDLLNGASIIVSGSCITKSENYQKTIDILRGKN